MPRATRFAMSLPLRYRPENEGHWSYGMTIDISRTGVLFRTADAPPAQAPVLIEVMLPGDEESGARVVGRGSVMRICEPRDRDHDHVVAATLDAGDVVRMARLA